MHAHHKVVIGRLDEFWVLPGVALICPPARSARHPTCFGIPLCPQDLSIWKPMPCAEVPDTFRYHTFRLADILVRFGEGLLLCGWVGVRWV